MRYVQKKKKCSNKLKIIGNKCIYVSIYTDFSTSLRSKKKKHYIYIENKYVFRVMKAFMNKKAAERLMFVLYST